MSADSNTIQNPKSKIQNGFHIAAIAIALLAIGVRFWLLWHVRLPGEDALITMRYAENLATGRGFVFNPGEHVYGTTTPLYTLILALFIRLRFEPILSGQVVNILADGLTCYLIARLPAYRRIGRPYIGLLAALFYTFHLVPISVSLSGMETGLVTCVGMGMIHAYVSRSTRLLYPLSGMLFLLRIDGLLLFGILAIGLCIQQRRFPWQDAAIFMLIALPWLIFACFYFGSPLPQSLLAKVVVYKTSLWIPNHYSTMRQFNLETFRKLFFHGWMERLTTPFFLIGLFTPLGPPAHTGLPTSEGMTTPLSPPASGGKLTPSPLAGRVGEGLLLAPILWILLYFAALLISYVPAFVWYFMPPWPLYSLISAFGLFGSYTLLRSRIDWPGEMNSKRIKVGALIVLTFFGLMTIRVTLRELQVGKIQQNSQLAELGIWLGQNVAPEERILLEPIGYTGYYSKRRIIDVMGLISPEVVDYYRKPNPLGEMTRAMKPEWICLQPHQAEILNRQAPGLLEKDYMLLKTFNKTGSASIFYVYHIRKSSQ